MLKGNAAQFFKISALAVFSWHFHVFLNNTLERLITYPKEITLTV